MSNKILNLDLSKDPIMPAIVYGRVGDDRLQTVTVNVTRRDEVADLTGYDITFEGTTCNGQTKVFDSNNVSSNASELKKGTFDYTFPNMAFAVAGKYEQAYFSIVKDGKRDSTAGFEIYVDGNADIDAPEAETIITEYNKLVAELNKLQNEAIDEMDQNFAVAQERIVELENQISDLRSQIEQALADFETGNFWTKEESFNKEQSSANVIDQVSGKEKTTINFVMDFKNKTAGSDVENPHRWSAQSFGTLLSPTSAWLPIGQNRIDQIKNLDGVVTGTSTSTNGRMEQNLAAWNIFEIVKRRLGDEYFISQGATTTASKVAILRKIITKANYKTYGFGLGASGNKISSTVFGNVEKSYSLETSHSNSTITEIGADIPIDQLDTFISEEGFIFINTYAGATDGVTPSKISVDYVSVEFTIEVSANEIIKSEIAANHEENLATPEEAKAGTDTTKTMTPATTAQSIDNRAVTLASNQTIGGIKNFKDGLMVNDTSVVADKYIEKAVVTTNTTDFTADSTVYFQRWGRMVVANVSITNKSANFAAWKTLMQFPDGYKPNRRNGWGGTLANNTNRAPSLSLYANNSGISVMSPTSDFPASQNCVGTIVYFTSDAWPS